MKKSIFKNFAIPKNITSSLRIGLILKIVILIIFIYADTHDYFSSYESKYLFFYLAR